MRERRAEGRLRGSHPGAAIGTSLLLLGAATSWAEAPDTGSAPAPELATPSAPMFVAERITEANFEARQVGGPDADAGIGDWFLGNGTICAAISDPEHESPLAPRGGILIDLGHCGRADDQWSVLQPLLNLAQDQVVPVDAIVAGHDAKRAFLETRAEFRGVELRTTYAVDLETPTALSVSLRARRVREGEPVFAVGTIALHASGQMASFALDRRDLASSRGFAHPPADRSSTRRLLASLGASDWSVLVGGEELPPISYGLERVSAVLEADGDATPLVAFVLTGGHYTLGNALVAEPWFGDASGVPGLLQLLQIPFMDLEPGTVLAIDHRIFVGERADVASITDHAFADSPRVHGRVDDPSARIHVALASGAPISEVRPDGSGDFALRLPPGTYHAEARTPDGRRATQSFEIPAAGPEPFTLPPFALATTGHVRLPSDFIGRLVFLRSDGGGPVRFGADALGFRIGDESIPNGLEADFLNLAGPPAGRFAGPLEGPTGAPASASRSGESAVPQRIALAPGRYRVVAVRGPEYAARALSLEVRADEETTLALEPLPRVAPTPGFLAADLHVHTGQSFDSSLPVTRQLEAFAASGAEVLVSTEHDRIFDPRPALVASGLERELVGVVGSELTSAWAGGDSPYTSGHLNAFPLTLEPKAFRRGAIRFEGRRLRDVLADLRARPAPPFVQINHPRADLASGDVDGYFENLGVAGQPFAPERSLSEAPNAVLVEKSKVHGMRDLDVEGVELLNAASLARYRRVRADWLSLLLQGERLVGTANSDSHRLGHVVGLPRTYVAVADDRLEAFDEAAFMAGLRAGRAYGSTGPLLLRLRLGEAGIGEVHAGRSGVLEIEVGGADWIPVSTWRVYVNGELVHRAPIARGETRALPLAFAADALVTVEVEGPAEGLYRDVLPGFVPFAFSNPIRVDADGDGHFDAPGLPAQLPATISRPDEPDREPSATRELR